MIDADFTVAISQRNVDDEAIGYITRNGCRVHVLDLPQGQGDDALGEDELADALKDCDAWIVGHARVTRSLLVRLPRLRAVCRRGVGHDRVDLAAVRSLGKVATIAAGGNDAAVADHVIGLMLAVSRRHRECRLRLERADWSIPVGSDLFRKTVGIVGLGRIGSGVVARLSGFESRLLAVSPSAGASSWAARGVELVPLERLLAECDFVSLHLPLTERTRFIVDKDALEAMKPGAILINTARGGLVDDEALLTALRAGRLAGAGLDVFMSEADPRLAQTTRELLALPNVVATSHAAGSTVESLKRTNWVAAQCAVGILRGHVLPPGVVVADGRPP
ncbi:phosphoglycerate dehydrogenase [Variovorax sp. KK3]|uniref:phosphoglycerate dehydrogenase n=1 Tax=Variovorax sp. KK3 TaxID=1855728 RepID=UPI00097BD289|nr:phosphoglycerate dehydrogenase [Variovorax sp. KK3]